MTAAAPGACFAGGRFARAASRGALRRGRLRRKALRAGRLSPDSRFAQGRPRRGRFARRFPEGRFAEGRCAEGAARRPLGGGASRHRLCPTSLRSDTQPHRRWWTSRLGRAPCTSSAAPPSARIWMARSITTTLASCWSGPHARIIIMLRDPVDRLYSQYVAALGHGLTSHRFADWTLGQAREEAGRHPPFGAVWTGRYTEHLCRYQVHFPGSQIRVCFYEDYIGNG